jgi:hypothetical protein
MNQAAKRPAARATTNARMVTATCPPVAYLFFSRAFKAPTTEAKRRTMRKVSPPVTVPSTYLKNLPPKKVVTPPKASKRSPMMTGLLERNLTSEVAWKTGHPDLWVRVTTGLHALVLLTATFGLAVAAESQRIS